MSEDNEPPDEGKKKPREDERESKYKQRPAPLCIHEGREDILEVSAPALGYVPLDHVAVPVLKDDALSHATRCVSSLTISETKKKQL